MEQRRQTRGRREALVVAALVGICLGTACSAPPDDDLPERMLAEHRADDTSPSPVASREPAQPVVGRPVVYGTAGGRELTGYLARPDGARDPLPALIVIHEWWGLNENIRAMTRRLAGEGYAALAVDLYDGRIADDPDAAHDLMREATADPADAEANLAAALEFVVERLRAPRVGTIGWCFGGGWSLNAALAMPDRIDAVVVYYGRLESDPELLARLRTPLLGLFGGRDRGIPLDSVRAFERALERLGADARIVVYDEAGHAFANPTGRNHDPEAAADAWDRTVAFLAEQLGRR